MEFYDEKPTSLQDLFLKKKKPPLKTQTPVVEETPATVEQPTAQTQEKVK